MNFRSTFFSGLLCMVLAFEAPSSAKPGAAAPKTVILVVDDLLLPEIQAEVNRLQADLIHEGYAVKIKPWNAATQGSGDLWSYLRSEYGTIGQVLNGAILIGWLPVAKNNQTNDPTDLVYWKLTANYGDTGYWGDFVGDIWISRMWPAGYVDDVTLLKRALQANHDARTGAARLPHSSYWTSVAYPSAYYDTISLASLLEVWPTSEIPPIPMINVFQKGGDCFQEEAHGGPGAYNIDRLDGDTPISSDLVHDAIMQIRSLVNCSCVSGALGGVVNNQLFTRGGGNVLSIGATQSTYSGAIWITPDETWGPRGPNFRSKLASGASWGDALLASYPFQDVWWLMFFGDLSIRAKASPPNQMPVVNSLTYDQWNGPAPLTVKFAASASDPDGSIANYEWFPIGHCLGRVDPSATGTSASTTSFTYTAPHRYLARVEVTDNYKARAYKEVEIRVAPPLGQPIRVACGRQQNALRLTPWYQPDYDYVDSQGHLWLHDQAYVGGTWGGVNTPGITGDWQWEDKGNVGGTFGSQDDRNALFHHFSTDNARDGVGAIYYLPCANGAYTVNLGFADMVAWTAGQRLADVFINDVQMLTAFDCLKEFGPKTAAFKSFRTTVVNGMMKIQLKTNPASGSTIGSAPQMYSSAILNCFEVLPDGGSTVIPTYALNVANGSGSGSYQAGTMVSISANPAPSGLMFDRWTGATVADASASTTTLTMPASATTVTATYEPVIVSVASLSATPSSVAAGAAISVTWSGATSPTGTDWIGCYKVGDPDTSYGEWHYTAGAPSGTVAFTAPAGVGQVEFRYFYNNGYDKLATSNAVTIAIAGGGVDPSLMAYWKLDDGGGFVAADAGGAGQSGTLVNGPSWTVGRIGGGLTFDGADDYVALGGGASLNVGAGASFTITAWFKTTESYGTIFSARNSAQDGAVIDLTVGYDGAVSNAGCLMGLVREDQGSSGYARVTGAMVNDGAWHHAALTRNAGGMIELFLDGVSQGTGSGSQSAGPITTDLRALGCERRWVQDAYGTADQRHLNGSLDEARIYNRALSVTEIESLR